jgi:hypothetical protein
LEKSGDLTNFDEIAVKEASSASHYSGKASFPGTAPVNFSVRRQLSI